MVVITVAERPVASFISKIEEKEILPMEILLYHIPLVHTDHDLLFLLAGPAKGLFPLASRLHIKIFPIAACKIVRQLFDCL